MSTPKVLLSVAECSPNPVPILLLPQASSVSAAATAPNRAHTIHEIKTLVGIYFLWVVPAVHLLGLACKRATTPTLWTFVFSKIRFAVAFLYLRQSA